MKHQFTIKKHFYLARLLVMSFCLLHTTNTTAQSLRPESTHNTTIDATIRTEVIEGALTALNERYVFPEVAKKMDQAIRERIARKEYDQITDAGEFARTFASHLQEVSRDKHLRIMLASDSRFGAGPQRLGAVGSKRNFGFEKVERLGGNIGYLDLRGFEPAGVANETATAAMNFLANTDALIFDLRQNGGGTPEMVAFLSSYLFDKRVHLNDIYERPSNTTREFWTQEKVPGKHYGNKPVFVLISNRTFSAAEEFTYNLQSLKRATIVGETSGGGAHLVQPRPLAKLFVITVPFARSINPITKTNWESTGVKPDIEVPADRALKVAHLAALRSIETSVKEPQFGGQLKMLVEGLQKEVGDISLPAMAQSSPRPGSAKLDEADLIKEVGALIDKEVASDRFSGVVMIAKDGKPVFERAAGLASKSYNVPNRMDTKFNLGSINKIFTQIAIMQLVETGKLSLDDTIGKYLPDYPNKQAAEKATVKHLIDMQSGIGDFFGPKFQATPKNKIRTISDYLPLFADQPLKFEPGTNRSYSNGGYIVLGAIIEKVSGQNYYDYVRERIFKPAEMQNTDSYEADTIVANLATGYTRRGDRAGELVSNIFTIPARGSSAGGGYSTAEDLLKFSLAIQNNKLLGAENSRKFGALGIAGGAPGINATLEMGGKNGYTIIILSNYDPPSAEDLNKKIRRLI